MAETVSWATRKVGEDQGERWRKAIFILARFSPKGLSLGQTLKISRELCRSLSSSNFQPHKWTYHHLLKKPNQTQHMGLAKIA